MEFSDIGTTSYTFSYPECICDKFRHLFSAKFVPLVILFVELDFLLTLVPVTKYQYSRILPYCGGHIVIVSAVIPTLLQRALLPM